MADKTKIAQLVLLANTDGQAPDLSRALVPYTYSTPTIFYLPWWYKKLPNVGDVLLEFSVDERLGQCVVADTEAGTHDILTEIYVTFSQCATEGHTCTPSKLQLIALSELGAMCEDEVTPLRQVLVEVGLVD